MQKKTSTTILLSRGQGRKEGEKIGSVQGSILLYAKWTGRCLVSIEMWCIKEEMVWAIGVLEFVRHSLLGGVCSLLATCDLPLPAFRHYHAV